LGWFAGSKNTSNYLTRHPARNSENLPHLEVVGEV
jgi:hypothetical protein